MVIVAQYSVYGNTKRYDREKESVTWYKTENVTNNS